MKLRAVSSDRPSVGETAPSGRRSLLKAVTYRLVVMCADAIAIYLLTGRWRLAAGFMIASNIYTTVLYFLHERIWARIGWGTRRASGSDARAAPVEARPEAIPLRSPRDHLEPTSS